MFRRKKKEKMPICPRALARIFVKGAEEYGSSSHFMDAFSEELLRTGNISIAFQLQNRIIKILDTHKEI